MSKLGWMRMVLLAAALGGVLFVACGGGGGGGGSESLGSNPLVQATDPTAPPTTTTTVPPIDVLPGMPPVVDRNNLYSETASTKIADMAKDDRALRVRPQPGGQQRSR